MFECFHCGAKALVWQCDYDGDDLGYDDVAIVQMLECSNCGAEVEYRIPKQQEEDQQQNEEE